MPTHLLSGHALDSAWRKWSSGWGERTVLWAHTGGVSAVAFSPDGTRILTGSFDKAARLWSSFKSIQNLVDVVKTSMPRCLTPIQREAFHLGTPALRWCYTRDIWPFANHGPSTAATWDERLLADWDRVSTWFSKPVAK